MNSQHEKTDRATVFSRRGHDFSRRFRTIASAFANLPNDTIVDDEVVALDSDGRPNFNALQNAMRGRSRYWFNLLAYRGKNLMNLPLSARRAFHTGKLLRYRFNQARKIHFRSVGWYSRDFVLN